MAVLQAEAITTSFIRISFFGLRFPGYGLRVTGCGLWVGQFVHVQANLN
jgi:hypothetical protein